MREVCNAQWDDIQDRLKEKDAEIERLKTANMAFSNEVSLSEGEIHRLKTLITRAADALADGHGMWIILHENCKVCRLIAELRKAAE
jgi:hypothetical protein